VTQLTWRGSLSNRARHRNYHCSDGLFNTTQFIRFYILFWGSLASRNLPSTSFLFSLIQPPIFDDLHHFVCPSRLIKTRPLGTPDLLDFIETVSFIVVVVLALSGCVIVNAVCFSLEFLAHKCLVSVLNTLRPGKLENVRRIGRKGNTSSVTSGCKMTLTAAIDINFCNGLRLLVAASSLQ
jgi:hypothetical protein